MARVNRTRFVILGMLALEPATGYDIKQSIQGSVGHFWTESYGQLYPTLARLSEEGLVEKEESSTGSRRKVLYHITDSGRDALATWLREPPVRPASRNELLLKMFFGRHCDLDILLQHLRESRSGSTRELHALRAMESQLQVEEADSPDLAFWLLTIRLGQHVAQARANWASEALKTLTEREAISE